MIQIPSALLEPPAPAPAKQGKDPPGGAPPDAPFSAVLDDHQARTAVAEGHHRQDGVRREAGGRAGRDEDAARDARGAERGEAPIGAGERDPSGAGGDEHDADLAQGDAARTSALAALLGGVPLPAEVVVTATPIVTATPSAASGAGELVGAAGLPAATATDAAPAQQPMPTGPAIPADAPALPLRPVAAQATAGTELDAATTSADEALAAPADATSAPARATRLADVLQAATARSSAASASATPALAGETVPSPATVAGAAGRAQAGPDGPAPAAQSATPAAPAVAATPAPAAHATATPAAPAAPPRGVGLEHAVETVRLALRAAADRGVSHARIALSPRELGGIEIHLRQTADGLVARVVAEHATAARLLQHAGGELRRSLEQQGLTLLQLDVGASGEQGGRAADRRALADGFGGEKGGRDRGSRAGEHADPLAPLEGAAGTITTTTLALPNGALVDVLA